MNKKRFFSNHLKWLFAIILFFSVCVAYAEPSALVNTSSRIDIGSLQLNLAKQRLHWIQQDLSQFMQSRQSLWNNFLKDGVSQSDLDHAAFAVANAQAMLGNIKISLTDANAVITFTQNEMADIKKNNRLVGDNNAGELASIQAYAKQHDALQSLLNIQNQRIDFLNQSLDFAQQKVERLKQWHYQLQKLFQNQVEAHRQQLLTHQETQLQQQEGTFLEKLLKLNQQFDVISSSSRDQEKAALQFQIFVTQEQISINRLQLFWAELNSDVQTLIATVPEAHNGVALLYDNDDQAAKLLSQLNDMSGTVEDKIQLLDYRKHLFNGNQAPAAELLLKGENQNQIIALIKAYQQRSEDIQLLQSQLNNYRAQIAQVLKHQFTIRQTLPGLSFTGWLTLMRETLRLPVVMWSSIQNAATQFWYQLRVMSDARVYFMTLIGVLMLVSWIFLRRSFIHLLDVLEETTRRFSGQVLSVTLILIKRNLGILLIYFALLGLAIWCEMEIYIWVNIVMVVMIYRFVITLMKLWLTENSNDVHGRDELYKGLRWVLILAMVLTIFTYASHTLPVPFEVKELFNRIFMLLSLVLAMLLFRAWSVLPTLLQRVFAVRKKYIVRAIHLICWVTPITLLTNAIVGLMGYVNFAWVIGKYQIISLIVLTIYMIIRGIITDIMEFNYEFLIRHFKSGWLWGQAFVRPIDRALRLALLFLMCAVLAHFFGLDRNQAFLAEVHRLATTNLFTLAGNTINLKFIIGLIVFTVILYWFGKWSREFAFRWLYKRAKDIGARNSLSIFTQYLIVIFGVIVGLRILGVDLKAFAVVAVACTVSIGYALRDQASNFFSGIFLLIERPFRNGDMITMGEYEGEVVDTGMRAVKIRTNDHMEVMIPYSQMYLNPFVNWTHHDPIVRTTIKINVDRQDDPHVIRELIFGVLKTLSSVLEHPEPRVYMREINRSLLEFEVRYFINLHIVKSRDKIRSEVLFSIWDCFKKNNIQAPHPHYELHVRQGEESRLIESSESMTIKELSN